MLSIMILYSDMSSVTSDHWLIASQADWGVCVCVCACICRCLLHRLAMKKRDILNRKNYSFFYIITMYGALMI